MNEAKDALKKVYKPPKLTVLGTVANLTHVKNPGPGDGQSNQHHS